MYEHETCSQFVVETDQCKPRTIAFIGITAVQTILYYGQPKDDDHLVKSIRRVYQEWQLTA